MKKFFTRNYFSIASTALLLFFGTAQFANASPLSAVGNAVASGVASVFNGISYIVIGKIAFGIAYIIAWLGGVVLAVEAWLVGAMLGINTGVFQSQIVQKGFGVTLSIANLGFVLGIIVIAVATILHRETYGYKKILWKLVFAAILVNFSLVIAAPIFNLGNSFTQYFLNCADPSVGCSAPSGATAFTSMNYFAQGMAGAFNPQTGLLTNPSGSLTSASAALGESLGNLLTPLISIIFVVFELIATVIVLGVFIGLLVTRYIYIAFLAILMPFAWLGWVFPNISSWWSKWWSEFFRWTFFAPIVVFFIWLAIQTEQAMATGPAGQNQSFGTYTSTATSNIIWGPIATFFTSAFSPIVSQLLNSLILIGLTVGGMYVADKMSIAGAKTAVDSAKSVGKATQGYVWKKTKRIAGDRLRRLGRKTDPTTGETTTGLQRFGAHLQGVPGIRAVGAFAAKTGSTEAIHAEKEADIKAYIEHNLKALPNAGLIKRAQSDGFLDETESAAIGQELAKRKLTGSIDPAKWNRYIDTMSLMGNLKNEDVLKSLDNPQLIRVAASPNAFITDAQAAAIGQEIAKRSLTNDPSVAGLMTRFIEAAQKVGKAQDILNNRPDLIQARPAGPGGVPPAEPREAALIRAVRGIKDIVQIDSRMLDVVGAAGDPVRQDEIITMALNLTSGQINKLASDGNAQQQNNLRNSIVEIADQFTSGALTLTPERQRELNRIIEVYKKNPLLQEIP